MKPITVLKVVLEAISLLEDVSIILHDEMVPQFFDWQQALQACVHIAVIGVIVEANDAIFKRGHCFVFLLHCCRLNVVLLPLPLYLLLFSEFNHLEF